MYNVGKDLFSGDTYVLKMNLCSHVLKTNFVGTCLLV